MTATIEGKECLELELTHSHRGSSRAWERRHVNRHQRTVQLNRRSHQHIFIDNLSYWFPPLSYAGDERTNEEPDRYA
ncbi:hypothetical protein AMELA_G00094640 [Ameiurus melas]|uniref:Uncharacterized protein n=1 Tax=Ameiurus melas TaxID=219545 RepID=A0A7J6AYW9_AMEME|nr:hypothetical protein AMELA_G00094640 [Ameiurus melas]